MAISAAEGAYAKTAGLQWAKGDEATRRKEGKAGPGQRVKLHTQATVETPADEALEAVERGIAAYTAPVSDE